jgi:ATPase family associated with various cellular activities (AAA)
MFDTLEKMVKIKPLILAQGNALEGRFLKQAIEQVSRSLSDFNVEIVTGGLRSTSIDDLTDKYHDYLGTEKRMVIIEASDDFSMPKNLARVLPVYRHPNPTENEITKLYLEHSIEATERTIGLARGLSYAELEISLKEAKNADDFWAHVADCRRDKLALIGMNIEPPPIIKNVAGLDDLMKALPGIKAGFSERARRAGLGLPKGVLFFGIPGTGKTLVSSIIAEYLDLAMLSLGIDLVCDGGVEPLKKMLAMAEECSPCILQIDEIDKFFAVGSKKEPLGYLLKWLNDRRKPVFVIGTGNSLVSVPPELLRAGRWNEIYGVGMPDANGLVALFMLFLARKDARYSQPEFVSNSNWRKLADAAINCVGAEVAEIVDRVVTQMVLEEAPMPLKINFQQVLAETARFKKQFARNSNAMLEIMQQIQNVCTPANGSTQILERSESDMFS